MEALARAHGQALEQMDFDAQEALYQEARRRERDTNTDPE
jgi:ATP diphosphatase